VSDCEVVSDSETVSDSDLVCASDWVVALLRVELLACVVVVPPPWDQLRVLLWLSLWPWL
jgi:hypothetical protein